MVLEIKEVSVFFHYPKDQISWVKKNPSRAFITINPNNAVTKLDDINYSFCYFL